MPIERYIDLEFEYCQTFNKSCLQDVILIKICYAHFMHIVSRTVDKKFFKLKNHKKIILEIFSLLCLSRDFEEFDLIFHNLCILLLTKNKKKFDCSIQVIAKYSQRHANDINDIAKETYEFLEDCNAIDIDDESSKNTTYTKSPFYKKYNKIVALLEVDIDKKNMKIFSDEISNEMFSPEFLNHILTLWLPYIPFWTAVDLDLINPNISRLSNAYIEATHRVNKNYVVQKTENTSLGDVVRLLKHRRKDVLSRIFLKVDLKGPKKNKKPLYPETTSNPNLKEVCKKKHIKSKGHDKSNILQIINESNMLMDESIKNENTLQEINKDTDQQVNDLKRQVLDKMKNRKRKGKSVIKSNKKIKKLNNSNSTNIETVVKDIHNNAKENSQEYVNSQNFTSTNYTVIDDDFKKIINTTSHENLEKEINQKQDTQENLTSQNFLSKNFKFLDDNTEINVQDKFENGLINNIKYYSKCTSSEVIIGLYYSSKCVTREMIDLSAKEFSTAFGQRWFNGLIIDSYVMSCIENWGNVSYVITDDTISVIGNLASQG